MRAEDVRRHAGTPLTTPVYPLRFTRFTDREYFNVVYRTDPEALRAVVPEPLEIDEPPPAEKPTTPIRSAPCSRRRRISVRNARRGAGCRTFSGYRKTLVDKPSPESHEAIGSASCAACAA
jgi:hypothetical protein